MALAAIGTCATAGIILWQAWLLRIQNQLQALLKLNSTWESKRLLKLRADWARKERTGESKLEESEPLLEFLEEFAGLAERKVLDRRLVWDSTIGWYAARYYLYNKENGKIEQIRTQWGPDPTLYRNLEWLGAGYLEVERRERGINEEKLVQQIRNQREAFLKDEEFRYACQFSKGSG